MLVSIDTPPNGAFTCPSSEVPTPYGMDRHMVGGAQAHDLRHLGGILRVHHEGRVAGFSVQVVGVAVLLAHREARHHPVAIALEQVRRSAPSTAARIRLSRCGRFAGRMDAAAFVARSVMLKASSCAESDAPAGRGSTGALGSGLPPALLGVHDTRRAGAAKTTARMAWPAQGRNGET